MQVEGSSAGNRIAKDRQCRDVLFLIIFIAFWVGMLICAGVGFSQGDPRLLLFGLDYKGNLCGIDNEDSDRTVGNMKLDNFKNRYWPDMSDIIENMGQLSRAKSICLASCPSMGDGSRLRFVCDYPEQEGDDREGHLNAWRDREYDYFEDLSDDDKASSMSLNGPCYPIWLNSSASYQTCQYYGSTAEEFKNMTDIDMDAVANTINDYLGGSAEIFQRYIVDIETAWLVIVVCGLVVPVVLSFVWLVLMRYLTKVFVWLTIILLNVFVIGVTLFTYVKAGLVGSDAIGSHNVATLESASGTSLDAADENKHVLAGMAVLMTVVAVLFVLFTLAMISRISIATSVLQVATQAVMATPSVVVFPLTTFLSIVVLTVYWIFVAVFLFSSGDVVQNTDANGEATSGYTMDLDRNLQYMLVYHFFGLLWGIQFILAFGQLVIAGAIASYYWTKGAGGEVSPVMSSMSRAVRYHVGSVAFGSFIVAVLEFIRVIMKYIEQKCKEATENSGQAGQFIKMFFCCIQCCLACVECVLKFINRQAYIVIAVDGSSYCTAVGRAIKLLMANVLRVAVVNTVGDCILFIGKCAVAFGAALLAYVYLESYTDDENAVSSPIMPVALVLLAAYAVGGAFMSVTEMAVDTVLLSYCIDCDENGGRAANAPPLLNDTLDKAEQYSKDKQANAGSNNTT